jgi:hypothetical protein
VFAINHAQPGAWRSTQAYRFTIMPFGAPFLYPFAKWEHKAPTAPHDSSHLDSVKKLICLVRGADDAKTPNAERRPFRSPFSISVGL